MSGGIKEMHLNEVNLTKMTDEEIVALVPDSILIRKDIKAYTEALALQEERQKLEKQN